MCVYHALSINPHLLQNFFFLTLPNTQDRFLLKDIGSMIFIVLNVIAHWCVTGSLFREDSPNFGLLIAFCVLFILGDVVKLAYFSVCFDLLLLFPLPYSFLV